MKLNSTIFLLLITPLVLAHLVPDADARGRRGGGFSRGGVASGGAFSDRTSAATKQRGGEQVNRQASPGEHQDDRQQWKDDNREDWQEHTEDRQEDRQDFVEDEHDDWDHHHNDWDDDGEFAAGVIIGATVVGAAAAASTPTTTQVTYVTTLPCEATAVSVEGVSYYKCSSSWYQRGYAGSQVTYIQVAAPPGF